MLNPVGKAMVAMKTFGNRYIPWRSVLQMSLTCCLTLLCLLGCKSAREREEELGNAYTSLSLRNFNITGENETAIKSIRLVLAKSNGGEVVYNQLLTWDGNTLPPADSFSSKPSDPIELTTGAGDYDFYLFANEASMGTENVGFLNGAIGNTVNLSKLKPVTFTQDEITTIDHIHKPLISVGILKKHTLQANGTKTDPEIVTASLVRNVAKFTLEVRRKKVSTDPAVRPGVKITGFELLHIPNSYQILFSNQPFLKTNAQTELMNLGRVAVDISDEDYNTTSPTEAIYTSPNYYLSEHLFERDGGINMPTTLKVYYTTADSNYATEVSTEFPVDAQSFNEIREEILKHIDAQYTNLNDISRYSVFRSLHYKVILNITDQKAEPTLDVVIQPWIQSHQDVEITDQIFNSTKDEVMLNYYEGAQNNVMILNNFVSGNLKWSVSGDNSDEWLEISSPSGNNYEHLDGTPITFTFRAKSFNDTYYDAEGQPMDAERQATITFTSDNYINPVKVIVKQRPRQLIRPQRRYVNFIHSGGTVTIPVESFGREWGVTIVSNVSTITSATGTWITASREGNAVKIKVADTQGIDLLRHAEVKLYDGTGEAAYIWVEQGNYIPVKISESGINYTILDRNLGALYSAYNRDAWKAGSEISNRERVARNGYYYQQGRIPDGYHLLGINPLDGIINQSLGDDMSTNTKVNISNRPNGPLKWGDLGTGFVYGKYTRDTQYSRFIKANETSDNATSANSSNSWFVNEGSTNTPYPSWTTLSGKKNIGVDPCPEGYRVPTIDELYRIIYHAGNQEVYSNIWVSGGIWLKGTFAEYSSVIDIYLPIVPRRRENGLLNIEDWLYDDYSILGYYASSTTTSKEWSVGTIDVTASHNYIDNSKKAGHAAGIVVRCIKDSED